MNDIIKLLRELKRIYIFMGINFVIRYTSLIMLKLHTVLKTKSLGCVDAEIKGDFKVNVKGISKVFDASALPLVREILLKNCYGILNIFYETVVDLGANLGVVGALIGEKCGCYIAVECNPEFKSTFEKHMQTNGVTKFHLINRYASSIDGPKNITVNKLIAEYSLSRIDLMKIDIEGVEKELFCSNTEWLDKVSELTMEVHPCFGVNEQEICNLLKHYGFSVEIFDLDLNVRNFIPSSEMGYLRAYR